MNKIIAALGAAAALIASPALAADASVTLVNNSSSEVYQVYMSDSFDGEWGPDLLGSETLPVGWDLPSMEPTVTDPGSCNYDLKVVFDNGREAQINDFDACEAMTISVRNRSFVIETIYGDTYTLRATIG